MKVAVVMARDKAHCDFKWGKGMTKEERDRVGRWVEGVVWRNALQCRGFTIMKNRGGWYCVDYKMEMNLKWFKI